MLQSLLFDFLIFFLKSSFSWSLLFMVITSLTQFCMLQNRESALEQGAELYNSVPSVNIWCRTECRSTLSDRGCVYRMKRAGSSTEPWGTPYNKERWLRFHDPRHGLMQTLTKDLLSVIVSSVQVKMVSMRSEKPICAPPRLSDVSRTLPLKRFQCSSDWRWSSLVLLRKIVLALPLSTLLSSQAIDGVVSLALCSQG